MQSSNIKNDTRKGKVVDLQSEFKARDNFRNGAYLVKRAASLYIGNVLEIRLVF